jgi:hypothetical protein
LRSSQTASTWQVFKIQRRSRASNLATSRMMFWSFMREGSPSKKPSLPDRFIYRGRPSRSQRSPAHHRRWSTAIRGGNPRPRRENKPARPHPPGRKDSLRPAPRPPHHVRYFRHGICDGSPPAFGDRGHGCRAFDHGHRICRCWRYSAGRRHRVFIFAQPALLHRQTHPPLPRPPAAQFNEPGGAEASQAYAIERTTSVMLERYERVVRDTNRHKDNLNSRLRGILEKFLS